MQPVAMACTAPRDPDPTIAFQTERIRKQEAAMSAVTKTTSVQIVWDDSVVLIFQFTDDSGNTQNCGFVHFGIQAQAQSGSTTQVSQILQVTQQQGIQISNDPGTWVETVKYGARGTSNQQQQISVTYDDTINIPYTTQTAQPFQLQQLYSITG
jgi:hypothetical protein